MQTFAIGALTFSVVDIVIFAICMVSAVFCCINGIVKELSKWFGLVVGLLMGFMFASTVGGHLATVLPESIPAWANTVIAFVLLVLAGFVLVLIFGRMLAKILETFKLGPLDHILGFIWGLALSMLFFGALVTLLQKQSLFDVTGLIESSAILSKIILPLAPQAAPLVQGALNAGIENLSGVVDAL